MINQKTLGEAFSFIRNGKSVKQSSESSGVPITRIETIADRTIDKERLGYADIELDELGKFKDYLLQEGDILMSHINSPKHLGKTAIYNGEPEFLIHGMNLLCLRTNIDICNSKYTNYYFQSTFFKQSLAMISNKSVNQASFSVGRLKKLEIPLPPLKTQQRLAGILDDAAALRDKTAQLLEEYDLLAQSIFLEMFGDPVINQKGWSKRKGLNFYDVKGRVGWKGYKKTDLRDEGPIVLGATHIDKFGNVNTAKSVHLTREKYLESPEIFIERNDLIFVQRGNTIGKIGIVNFDIGEATINPVVLILRAVRKNNPFFILHLMMSENLKKEVVDLNSGSAQPMITQKSIKEYDIIDVPVKLQNQFAEKIALIEQQKALAKQELQESEDLFNCLLQKAFKGELV